MTDTQTTIGVATDATVLRLEGFVTSEVLEDPDGQSPIGLLARGTLVGTFNGTFDYVGQRMVPADAPGVFFLTGTAAVHDEHGELEANDSVIVNSDPDGDGELVGLCELKGLTGRWAGATGYFQVVGHLTMGVGGREEYVGKMFFA